MAVAATADAHQAWVRYSSRVRGDGRVTREREQHRAQRPLEQEEVIRVEHPREIALEQRISQQLALLHALAQPLKVLHVPSRGLRV